MGSGLILLVIVGAWLAVLVPMALRSSDVTNAIGSVDKFHDAMRVLSRRDARAAAREAADEVPPADEPLLDTVRRLQGDGRGVLVVSAVDGPALMAADVAVAPVREGRAPAWGAHLVTPPGLVDACRLVDATGVARGVSRRAVSGPPWRWKPTRIRPPGASSSPSRRSTATSVRSATNVMTLPTQTTRSNSVGPPAARSTSSVRPRMSWGSTSRSG